MFTYVDSSGFVHETWQGPRSKNSAKGLGGHTTTVFRVRVWGKVVKNIQWTKNMEAHDIRCAIYTNIIHYTNTHRMLIFAHGRVNDPMAKLQFLRVGWGGVGWGGVGMMTFFELAHMVDATQLCLSCHCTHAGCYATVFVLSLHTCWMLRNCVSLVMHTCWMLRNCVCLVIAHMLMLRNCVSLVTAHMLDATQLCFSCHCTHAGC